ncbi:MULTISPECIES: sigma 54-interacting transcriptional regulator [unclassified Moraxella]|uniref:sigma 54-interacting transcriptional regulator n=1 Tax=unclassified Moraxella TaxID=2685852 RepID=UPI003AF7E4F8
MEKSTIWVIDDDMALRTILQDALSDDMTNLEVQTFGQAKLAWQKLQQLEPNVLPNVILTDIRMPMMDGLNFSEKIHAQFPQIPVIIMTAHADVQSAVDSYQTGAFDYLPKPFDLDDVVAVVQKALIHAKDLQSKNPTFNDKNQTANQQNDELNPINSSSNNLQNFVKKQSPLSKEVANETIANIQQNFNPNLTTPHNPNGIIGQSSAMQTVFRAIGRLSHTPITVLITGESGTGKELIAHALHQHSPRKHKPFIALNMAAIPHDLIESELFGHEKGAFTGATTTRQGRFEQAHGGTLFLDEIGDMPLPTQTRLLRVLANGEFFRVGGQKPIKVDVRIIAATHQHLENLVKQGKFREDLFYRLNVIRLNLPALRERREDIPLLVEFFMHQIARQMQIPVKTLVPTTIQALQAYPWQGNVRQLENTCRWVNVMAIGNQVQISDLPPEIIDFYQKNLQQKAEILIDDKPLTTANISEPSFNNSPSDRLPLENLPLKNVPTDNLSDKQPKLTSIPTADDWLTPLRHWANHALANGEQGILQTATEDFEKCLLEVALDFTDNHKGKASQLLGWGRNTLTRKYQQLIDDHE